ncbi:MAG: hypothetical protein JNM69_37770 [Archangium sp.]|nr:hypothetical protein [Archangium sp.]
MNRDALAAAACIAVPLFIGWWLWRRPFLTAGLDGTPDAPRSFGPRCWWVAVKANGASQVAQALQQLELASPLGPCNWACGLERAAVGAGSRLSFVTPAVDGWVFVVNWPAEAQADLEHLARLSVAIGHPVFGFGSFAAARTAGWCIAEGGRIKRAWGRCEGKTLYDLGVETGDERALDLSFSPTPARDDAARWERSTDEATVITLASKWTRDPTTLDAVKTPGVGLLLRRK